MKPLFEELDFQPTPLGDLILRRRRMAMLDNLIVYEVLLGNGYLMSSLFHDVEEALADLGLAAVAGDHLDVVVGGLGLGYTAVAALKAHLAKRGYGDIEVNVTGSSGEDARYKGWLEAAKLAWAKAGGPAGRADGRQDTGADGQDQHRHQGGRRQSGVASSQG